MRGTQRPVLKPNEVFLVHGTGCIINGMKCVCLKCPFPGCVAHENEYNLKETVLSI